LSLLLQATRERQKNADAAKINCFMLVGLLIKAD
jgi:hypothetical protein